MGLIIGFVDFMICMIILGFICNVLQIAFGGHEESLAEHRIAYRNAMIEVKEALTDQQWKDIYTYMLSCHNYEYTDLAKSLRERNNK